MKKAIGIMHLNINKAEEAAKKAETALQMTDEDRCQQNKNKTKNKLVAWITFAVRFDLVVSHFVF